MRHDGRYAVLSRAWLSAAVIVVAIVGWASAAPEAAEFVVRDVWNEAPVADAEFELVGVDAQVASAAGVRRDPSRGVWVVRTDATGCLRLPADLEPEALRSFDGEWTVLDLEDARPERRGVAWAHTTVLVTGEVVVDLDGLSAPDPLDIELRTWAHGRDHAPIVGRDEVPPGVSGHWLHSRGLTRVRRVGGAYRAVDDQGRFEFEIPRLPVTNVFAIAGNAGDDPTCNWAPACVRITAEQMARRRAELRFEIELGHFVAGRLVDPYGRAVPDTEFTLHVKREVTAEEFDPAVLTMVGHPYGGHGSELEDSFHAVYQIQGRTDADGRFALTSYSDGEAFLAVRPDSALNDVVFELGDVADCDTSGELVVPHAHFAHRVTILDRNGVPFRGHRVTLLDVHHDPVQTGRQVDVDPDGTIPARMLIPGHEYQLLVARPGGGIPRGRLRFVWEGQEQLDVSPFRVASGARDGTDDE